MNSEQRTSVLTSPNGQNQLLPNQRALLMVTQYLGVPLITTGVLIATSVNNNSFIQVALAFILLLIPWTAYQSWRTGKAYGLPIFSMIAGLHWLYFAVALFWGNRRAPVWYSNTALVSEESITNSLLMIVIGVCAIGIGMQIRFTKTAVTQPRESLPLPPRTWDYFRVLLVLGIVSSLFPSIVYILGEAGRQWILAFQSTVPLFAFLLLLRRYFRGEAVQADKILILLYIVGRALTGLGSGWSGSIFYLGIAIGLTYLLERRTVPIRAMLLLIVISIFLQPGKSDFRAAYWNGENNQADVVTRVNYWLEQSIQSWQEIFNDPSGELLTDNLRNSMLRVSLLTYTANVHDKTPTVVPFQQWSLYEFAVIGLVPRFVWPDKISGNDANRFFQVAYGISREDFLGNVSIASGFMTEAYISFGWVGVFTVMFLLGMFYRAVEQVFFRKPATVFAPSIGLLAITMLLRIETQLGLYLVGTIQAIVVAYLVLIPVFVINTNRRSLTAHNVMKSTRGT